MASWTYQPTDPATDEPGAVRPLHSAEALDSAVGAAHEAWLGWRRTGFHERAQVLRAAAQQLRERADAFADRMADEMGKPLAQGRGEAQKCAWVCEHYAEQAPSMLAPEPHESDGSAAHVHYEPLGLVLAIMPWNFPFWQVFRFAAPALMAGNGFLLKHAPGTPGCAEDIVDLLVQAGLPAGLAPALWLDEAGVEQVLADRRVAAVTLTGSTAAGRAVAALAGKHLKPSVLELGGSDPFIVLSDADVGAAARMAATSRFLNAGQSCIAAKRLIVEASVAGPFQQALEAELDAWVVGPPRDAATTVGPMARRDLRDTLHDQVQRSIAAGAVAVRGCTLPTGPGAFYPVSLLTGIRPGMPAWQEELFGPVAALRVVPDEEAAIAAANDTTYGLGASLWTQNPARAERIIARLAAGSVFVNGLVKSDPRLPFGGIRDSGWGRELGTHGIRAFTNAKTVWKSVH